MIVYKDNVEETKVIFKESLDLCEFLSFDCEMTGVQSDLRTDGTRYDTHQFRYHKYREIVKQYELIQIGITFYIRKPATEEIEEVKDNKMVVDQPDQNRKQLNKTDFYLERTFTFYLFKNSKLKFLSDLYTNDSEMSLFNSMTVCHPATLKFLHDNHFDFKTIITKGIHHNKLEKKDKIVELLKRHLVEGKLPNSILHLSKDNEEKLVEAVKKISKFLIFGPESSSEIQNNPKDKSIQKQIKIKDLNPSLTSYLLSINLKKLLKMVNFNLLKDKTDPTCLIVEKTKTVINLDEFNQFYINFENFCKVFSFQNIFKSRYSTFVVSETDLENTLNEELGFSTYIEMISQAKKPIVGHNLIFDLMFIFDKFIGDLPDKFIDFKQSLHKHFPIIIDNKFITSRFYKEFENTKLESLFKTIKKKKYDTYVEIKCDVINGFCFYSDIESNTAFHDAGYDSIITGRCFIYVLKAIENCFETENRRANTHVVGDEEIKKFKGVEVKKGFINVDSRQRLISDMFNKTCLALIEDHYDLCDFSEEPEEFMKNEETRINVLFKNVFVLLFKDMDLNIYEMAQVFENNELNISVVKIHDNAAFIEFIVERDENKAAEVIERILERVGQSEHIEKIYGYPEFQHNYKRILNLIR